MKYLVFGLTIETVINFNGTLQISNASTDVFIEEGEIAENARQLTRVKRRGIQARFGKTKDSIILNWEGIGKFKISEGKKIIFQNLGADEDTLKLFLLSEVIGIILYQRGFFLLHASAVEINRNGLVFMGVSGAGKSTTATAFGKNGMTVLTDDLTAIQIINGQAFVIPAFAQYKVWKSALIGLNIDYSQLPPSFEGADKFLITQSLEHFPKQNVLLKELVILYPLKSKVEKEKSSFVIAPVELIKHFPLPVQLLTDKYLQQHFQQSLDISESVSIKFKRRPKNFEDLETFVRELKDFYGVKNR